MSRIDTLRVWDGLSKVRDVLCLVWAASTYLLLLDIAPYIGAIEYRLAVSADGMIVAVGSEAVDFNDLSGAGTVQVHGLDSTLGVWTQVGQVLGGAYASAGFGDSLWLSPSGDFLAVANSQVFLYDLV